MSKIDNAVSPYRDEKSAIINKLERDRNILQIERDEAYKEINRLNNKDKTFFRNVSSIVGGSSLGLYLIGSVIANEAGNAYSGYWHPNGIILLFGINIIIAGIIYGVRRMSI